MAIANVARVHVVAKVDETDLNQLRPGQPVEIRGEGFRDLALSGELESIGVQGLEGDSQAGTMYPVVIALPPLTAAQQAVVRLGMSEGFGRRGLAGARRPARGLGRAHHGQVAVRHDDQLAAGVLDARHVIGVQHRAGAHQAVGRQRVAHGADAGQRIRRIQRHFDQAKARLVPPRCRSVGGICR